MRGLLSRGLRTLMRLALWSILAFPAGCAVQRSLERDGRMPAPSASHQDDHALLLGTWDLVSFTTRLPDGRVTIPWGNQPVGRITYDADGNVTALLMHQLRNEANGGAGPPEVQAAFSAYFGKYTVDAVRRIVTHHVVGSLSAERASGDLQRTYEFKDDALVLSFSRGRDGATVTNSLVWKRISAPKR